EPEIYTEFNDKIDYARKLLISHTVRFVPLILVAIFLVYSCIDREEPIYRNAILYILMALQYVKFYMGIVGYYLRTKKKLSDCK
ncbi:MAG: hypothetical protein ACRC3Y_14160, partial [Romboutsia sp.]|uniref:hypothetical protein n=1 Tax=Romboutsia sp. TaxID=1965302 RepID=UPI003F387E1C